MGKFGRKITLTEEAYNNLKKVKERLGARSWEELSQKLLEIVAGSGSATSGGGGQAVAGGYAKISVRREVYERLRSIAESRGLTMSEAVGQLLEYADLSSRVEEALATINRMVKEIHATISSTRPERSPDTAAASTTEQGL